MYWRRILEIRGGGSRDPVTQSALSEWRQHADGNFGVQVVHSLEIGQSTLCTCCCLETGPGYRFAQAMGIVVVGLLIFWVNCRTTKWCNDAMWRWGWFSGGFRGNFEFTNVSGGVWIFWGAIGWQFSYDSDIYVCGGGCQEVSSVFYIILSFLSDIERMIYTNLT